MQFFPSALTLQSVSYYKGFIRWVFGLMDVAVSRQNCKGFFNCFFLWISVYEGFHGREPPFLRY